MALYPLSVEEGVLKCPMICEAPEKIKPILKMASARIVRKLGCWEKSGQECNSCPSEYAGPRNVDYLFNPL